MAYTGVLEKDATKEQIMAAKKTVQIVVEVNGQSYVETFDGTKGLLILVNNGACCNGKSIAELPTMVHFTDALLRILPKREALLVMAHKIGLL
jgi:hypothetical protein